MNTCWLSIYNGTFGAHHFCVEYLCAFAFIDIGTIPLRLKNTVVNKLAAQHWVCLRFSLHQSAFVDFTHALPLSICERSTFMRMLDSFD